MSHPVFGAEEQPCGCVVYAFNFAVPCQEHEEQYKESQLRQRSYGRLFSQFAAKHARMPMGWENAALLAAADGDLTYPEFKTLRESKGGR